jgi:hypothetical protein
MPGKRRPEIKAEEIENLKYFDKLRALLARLHDDGCARDKAGNRDLHYDEYCLLVLLYLFNPVVTSLRGVQEVSELANVQKKLGCERASLGSLSEATTVFDPERLKPIIEELAAQVQPLARDARLNQVPGKLMAVDGTVIAALPKMMEASLRKQATGSGLVKWRLHTHFQVEEYVPTRIDVTPDGGGAHDERAVLERSIEADCTYVMDRGYAKFTLFDRIVDAGSSYVCRLRDNSAYTVLEQRALSDADRALHVLSDQMVQLGTQSKPQARPQHAIRLLEIRTAPHTSRGKYKGGSTGPSSDGILRLATNLIDVPAEIIALIYRYRWTIEIFFRFFKHVLGCRHLLSHSQRGIEIQTYCAIIACLLISLWTGHKPTKRTYEMVCHYFTGLASADELLAHIHKLKAHNGAAQKS